MLKLRAESMEIGGPFARWSVFQAADRPDRLEAVLLTGGGTPEPALRALAPGSSVTASLSGVRVFRGIIDRAREAIDAESGRAFSIVAHSAFHRLRTRLRERGERFYQVTDSEAAERIAFDLGLAPVVEPTPHVHRALEVRGDPLRFLRGRAREHGFQLAVSDGRLYFSKSLPSTGEPFSVEVGDRVVALELEDRGGVRGGAIRATGDARWRPLVGFDVKGLDGRARARYRSVRAIHELGSDGFTTQVELVEDGSDFSLWRDLESRGGGHDLEE